MKKGALAAGNGGKKTRTKRKKLAQEGAWGFRPVSNFSWDQLSKKID